MSIGLIVLIVLCLVSIGILLWLCYKAPLGRQDKDGYHNLDDQ